MSNNHKSYDDLYDVAYNLAYDDNLSVQEIIEYLESKFDVKVSEYEYLKEDIEWLCG